ncbi:4'-phosphopantetheinyl transferase family protein [Thalassotalea ganghwensis]
MIWNGNLLDTSAVFYSYTSNSIDYSIGEEALLEKELNQYRLKHSKKAKSQFLSSRGFIKKVISSVINVSPDEIDVYFEQQSVRLTMEHQGVTIAWGALSHSKNGVAVIFSLEKPLNVGVDIELINNKRNIDSLIEICCHPKEKLFLAHSNKLYLDFYQVWTLKEALTKATRHSLTTLFTLDSKEVLAQEQLQSLYVSDEPFALSIVFPRDRMSTFIELPCYEN